jgi:hypothetical protein
LASPLLASLRKGELKMKTPAVIAFLFAAAATGSMGCSSSGSAQPSDASGDSTTDAPPASGDAGADTSGSGGSAGGDAASTTGLVVNGDFSNGDTEWSVTNQGTGNESYAVTAGQLCISMGIGGSITLGYPTDVSAAIPLAAGVLYTLSYQVSATAPVNLEVKLGQAVPPYTADADYPNEPTTAQLSTITHQFALPLADDQAGLAFNAAAIRSPATICFAQVSLTKD